MNVGFIGLGLMGRPMALHLEKAGHHLHLWARRPESLAPFAGSRAKTYGSLAELAANVDVVFTMVADAADVETVCLGENGLAAGVKNVATKRSGLIVVDMSTIGPTAARQIGQRLAALGIEFIDAPVSGGEVGAINATLTIMVGGKPEAFEKVRPLFEKLGKSVTLIGPSGAGQVAKACNQIVTGVGVLAVAEAFNFAQQSAVDPAKVRDALLGGFAYSKVLENQGQRMLERNFKPGFKAWMHQKDLRIVMEEAYRMGLMLPSAAAAAQAFNAVVGCGMGEDDSISMLRLLEQMSSATGTGTSPKSAGMPPAAAGASEAAAGKRLSIGFIGLGTMGNPMVGHLLKAGHTVSVWARPNGKAAASAASLLQAGARMCASPTELARCSEIVCTNVTGSADVEGLAAQLAEGFAPGSMHVDFSTIAPSAARHIAAMYAERGVDFVDAPVSGGGGGAQSATLSIMWGGKSALAARLAPLFECLGKTVVHVGESGAGQVAKACNQLVMVAAIQTAAEAARLAQAAGIDFSIVRQAMLGGSANSRVLEVFGGRMATRDFTAGVEARLHHKDYAALMNEAAALGVPMPVSAAVWQQLNALMGQGLGQYDSSILLRVLEFKQGEHHG